MKKSIAILLVAVLALGSVSAFALQTDDSATAIKKAATNAIKNYKNGDNPNALTEIKDLLNAMNDPENNVSEKQKTVILNAIKTALNTATLKSYAAKAAEALDGNGISVTKAAGGKYNISIVVTDSSTGSVIKEDIPKAAVEKPTLSTNPAVNAR